MTKSMETATFAEYDQYLSLEFLPDYWYDEAVIIAGQFISKFSANDWTQLADSWAGKPVFWKVRCAETLDTDLILAGAAILTQMLSDVNHEVVLAAVDGLRSWPRSSITLTDAEITQLTDLHNRSTGIEKLILSAFLQDRN